MVPHDTQVRNLQFHKPCSIGGQMLISRHLLIIAVSLIVTTGYHAYVQHVTAGTLDEISRLAELVPEIEGRIQVVDGLSGPKRLIAAIWVYLYSIVFSFLFSYALYSWRRRKALFSFVLALLACAIPFAADHSSATNADKWEVLSANALDVLPPFRWYRPGVAEPRQQDVVDSAEFTRDELFRAIAELEAATALNTYSDSQAMFAFQGISRAHYARTGERPNITLGSMTHTFMPESDLAEVRLPWILAEAAGRTSFAFRLMWAALVMGVLAIVCVSGNRHAQ